MMHGLNGVQWQDIVPLPPQRVGNAQILDAGVGALERDVPALRAVRLDHIHGRTLDVVHEREFPGGGNRSTAGISHSRNR